LRVADEDLAADAKSAVHDSQSGSAFLRQPRRLSYGEREI
jgi:hypothetical protein